MIIANSGDIGITTLSVRGNAKTKRLMNNKNIQALKKKGFIKNAQVDRVTKIMKRDEFSAMFSLLVDGRFIDCETQVFKSQKELKKGIEAVYQNTINVAQDYLGVGV